MRRCRASRWHQCGLCTLHNCRAFPGSISGCLKPQGNWLLVSAELKPLTFAMYRVPIYQEVRIGCSLLSMFSQCPSSPDAELSAPALGPPISEASCLSSLSARSRFHCLHSILYLSCLGFLSARIEWYYCSCRCSVAVCLLFAFLIVCQIGVLTCAVPTCFGFVCHCPVLVSL